MHVHAALVLVLPCLALGCAGKGSLDSTADCAAAEDVTEGDNVYTSCQSFAYGVGGLLNNTGSCDVDGDGAEEPSGWDAACVDDYIAALTLDCINAVVCGRDPDQAIVTLKDACSASSEIGMWYLHDVTEEDYCAAWDLTEETDECGGAYVSNGRTMTYGTMFWCPCLYSGDYGPNSSVYGTTVCNP